MVLRKHCLDVSLEEGEEKWKSETSWNQVQERRLGMTVDMHHEDGKEEPEDVGSESSVEVCTTVTTQAGNEEKIFISIHPTLI